MKQQRNKTRASILPLTLAALLLPLLIVCIGCKEEAPSEPTAEQIEEERQEHKSHAQREIQDMRN